MEEKQKKLESKPKVASTKVVSKYSYAILVFCGVLVGIITFLLFKQTQEILQNQIKERLIGIVTTASLQFDPNKINSIQDDRAIGTKEYIEVVSKLQDIRNANENITFSYIFRPTEDIDTYEFVADADSLDPYMEVDLNQDGIIDENDALNIPGEEYDVSEIPELRDDARFHPTTDAEPVVDQWGSFLSAYAPIKQKGETIAIVGIDVEITDWLSLINKTIIPFLLFVIFLILLLSGLTISLVRMWGSRVELVKELDRQKDELLSIVSHQLATPVSSIKWYLEMFLDGDFGKLTKSQKEQIQSLLYTAANLTDLVSMILDVSRIQLGRMKVDRTDLDLNVFFNEINTVIEPKSKEKKVEYIKRIPKNLPIASLDKRLMRMTLENLLSNAIKYTSEGGKVVLEVRVKDNALEYSVKDTGCGIPQKDQEMIFGKLFRASNVKKIDGNGFGLYVAKGAVEAQGGKISFNSKEGKGTTFHVILPITHES